MSHTGRSLAAASLIAVAAAFFVPVFADAASGFSGTGWEYAPYLQTVLDQFPLIVGLLALVVLGGVIANAN